MNISLIKCIVLYFYLTIIYNEFFTYIKTITLKKINLFTVVIITQFKNLGVFCKNRNKFTFSYGIYVA